MSAGYSPHNRVQHSYCRNEDKMTYYGALILGKRSAPPKLNMALAVEVLMGDYEARNRPAVGPNKKDLLCVL